MSFIVTGLWCTPLVFRLTSWQRRFITGHSEVINPLIDLTKKDSKVSREQNNTHEQAFRGIKLKLVDMVELSHPDYSKAFIVYSDASYYGIGGCLAQEYKEEENVWIF